MYETGGCSVDQSPYVMNQFDASHKNMVWPNESCDPSSVKGVADSKLGAFTFYAALKGCSTAVVSGNKALPINPRAVTNFNNTAHGRSVSYPASKNNHDSFLDSYPNNYGTGLPSIPGEAVDLYAPIETPVYAPFDGRIYHTGPIRSGCDFIIIQSLDHRSFAVLAHINDHPNKNTQVTAGQQIGELANLRSGAHLHFELWVDGEPVNAGASFSANNIWEAQKRALGF